jgi:GMP synthase (glutamine-hydrolysing)
VHRELATEAPPNTQTLAWTDKCCHAFRVPGKPFWAFQFHPELDCPTLTKRLGRYKDTYTDDADHLDDVIANFKDTPESNKLLEKFVSRVILKG